MFFVSRIAAQSALSGLPAVPFFVGWRLTPYPTYGPGDGGVILVPFLFFGSQL
ncbi:Hypothetical protein EAG7_04436 [Klebsiella aerogenes]|nr:Hypothetical protein EAG7_04436 [Klebsiella aerogenes]